MATEAYIQDVQTGIKYLFEWDEKHGDWVGKPGVLVHLASKRHYRIVLPEEQSDEVSQEE